ncbi:MAG TPA: hypothetical protein VKF35_12800 [Hyphomicrobiaceae bacterium]|nr:hypothetical protein [Hyphomicrobiaceae bacterium]
MFGPAASNDISPEEWRILRAHCEWSARYAMLWIIVTVIIFGGIFIMLDIVGAGERVEVPSLILLLAITTVNAIWRAAGVLAARIEMLMTKRSA